MLEPHSVLAVTVTLWLILPLGTATTALDAVPLAFIEILSPRLLSIFTV